MDLLFLDHFGGMEDCRVPGLVTYPLDEILLSTLSGLLSGADDWEDIVTLGEAHLEWLRGYLPFHHGIASADTYQKIFRSLDSDALASSFVAWVATLAGRVEGVVAVDGKTSRSSKQDASGGSALHMLSAFAHESGLVIGQKATYGKVHEITAIPELLAVLALEGTVVTIDAIGAQRNIADAILARGADYVIALKGNQGRLHEDIALFCKEESAAVTWDRASTTDGDHGRIEERACVASSDIGWLQERHHWPGLQSIAQVTSKLHFPQTSCCPAVRGWADLDGSRPVGEDGGSHANQPHPNGLGRCHSRTRCPPRATSSRSWPPSSTPVRPGGWPTCLSPAKLSAHSLPNSACSDLGLLTGGLPNCWEFWRRGARRGGRRAEESFLGAATLPPAS